MAPKAKGRPSGAKAPSIDVEPLTEAFGGVFEMKTLADYPTSPKAKAMDVELLLAEEDFLRKVQEVCPTFNIGRPKIFHALESEAKDTTSVPFLRPCSMSRGCFVRLVVRSGRISVLRFDN